MKTFEQKLDDYARLITSVGANIQKDEPLLINAPLEAVDFVRMLAKNAYALGAKDVSVNWIDEEIQRLRYEYAPLEVFEEVPEWAVERIRYYGEKGAATISISARNPELLKGMDQAKIAADNLSKSTAMKDVMKYAMNDINTWCILSIPTVGWAKKVFPGLTEEEAVQKLWEAIFAATRIGEGDAVELWREHLADLKFRGEYLNEKAFDRVIYRSSNGTNLSVGLPKGHIWVSGAGTNSRGTDFVANMPTEEVYTAPDARRVNGSLYSTKPLAYGGNLIDEFHLEFKDGEVVDFDAKVGKEVLADLLKVDANAKRLGEIALVPHDSPISNTNVLFYNTLFDENASCHFALGKAYPTCVKGGVDMTEEELEGIGINDSAIHEDFMVGSDDLSIVGIQEDGTEIPIFVNGNWAF